MNELPALLNVSIVSSCGSAVASQSSISSLTNRPSLWPRYSRDTAVSPWKANHGRCGWVITTVWAAIRPVARDRATTRYIRSAVPARAVCMSRSRATSKTSSS
jgi:hypothetical protein